LRHIWGLRSRIGPAGHEWRFQRSFEFGERADGADFNARYDGAARKLGLTLPKNAYLNVRVNPEDLSMYLKLPGTLVPHIHVSYGFSSFASTAEQNAFESTVRREVERSKARVSFSATGRPKSL
jgi:hypothetical protein